jgi:dynein heavy chain
LHTIPVDKLSYDFLFRDDITYKDVMERPESGALCYGLYLEGCKWDYQKH